MHTVVWRKEAVQATEKKKKTESKDPEIGVYLVDPKDKKESGKESEGAVRV